MSIAEQIRKASKKSLQELYSLTIDEKDIQINETKPEFEGDYTLVLFSFIKQLKNSAWRESTINYVVKIRNNKLKGRET